MGIIILAPLWLPIVSFICLFGCIFILMSIFNLFKTNQENKIITPNYKKAIKYVGITNLISLFLPLIILFVEIIFESIRKIKFQDYNNPFHTSMAISLFVPNLIMPIIYRIKEKTFIPLKEILSYCLFSSFLVPFIYCLILGQSDIFAIFIYFIVFYLVLFSISLIAFITSNIQKIEKLEHKRILKFAKFNSIIICVFAVLLFAAVLIEDYFSLHSNQYNNLYNLIYATSLILPTTIMAPFYLKNTEKKLSFLEILLYSIYSGLIPSILIMLLTLILVIMFFNS